MNKAEAHRNTRGISILIQMVIALANELPPKLSWDFSVWKVSVILIVKRVLEVVNAKVFGKILSGIELITNPLRPLIHDNFKNKVRHCHSSAPFQSSIQGNA